MPISCNSFYFYSNFRKCYHYWVLSRVQGIKSRLTTKYKSSNMTKRFGISEKSISKLLPPSTQPLAMRKAESEVFSEGKDT